MDTKWFSEPYKNLTFSTLITDFNLKIDDAKFISYAVSLTIYNVLAELSIPNLFIKWPNDIMSDQKKICGILIENTFTGNRIKNTIIGIGLNVNQTNFKELTNVSSLQNETGISYDLDNLLNLILLNLRKNFEKLHSTNFKNLENKYLEKLYRFKVTSTFVTANNEKFTGKITGISSSGNLEIETKNGDKKQFGIKEISFA